jgi:hypothetical protein
VRGRKGDNRGARCDTQGCPLPGQLGKPSREAFGQRDSKPSFLRSEDPMPRRLCACYASAAAAPRADGDAQGWLACVADQAAHARRCSSL